MAFRPRLYAGIRFMNGVNRGRSWTGPVISHEMTVGEMLSVVLSVAA